MRCSPFLIFFHCSLTGVSPLNILRQQIHKKEVFRMYFPILYFYRELNLQGSDSESSLLSTKPHKTSCKYPDFFYDTLHIIICVLVPKYPWPQHQVKNLLSIIILFITIVKISIFTVTYYNTLVFALKTLHLKTSSSFEIKLKICKSWESCDT